MVLQLVFTVVVLLSHSHTKMCILCTQTRTTTDDITQNVSQHNIFTFLRVFTLTQITLLQVVQGWKLTLRQVRSASNGALGQKYTITEQCTQNTCTYCTYFGALLPKDFYDITYVHLLGCWP